MRCGCGECRACGWYTWFRTDVIWMSVLRGMRGVCVYVWLGRRGWRGGEWMRGLGLGFTNHVRTGGVLDVCLCLGCGDVGGVGGERVGGLDQGLE